MTNPAAPRPLTQLMRAALVSRFNVKPNTAHAMADRGLAVLGLGGRFGYEIKLTEAGEAERAALLAPLRPGARVRNTITGLIGTLIEVQPQGEHYDIAMLLWDDEGRERTAGSPAYLEVDEDEAPEVASLARAKEYLAGGTTLDEYMPAQTFEGDIDASAMTEDEIAELDGATVQLHCGYRWVAEIGLCPRCGLGAAAHDPDAPSEVDGLSASALHSKITIPKIHTNVLAQASAGAALLGPLKDATIAIERAMSELLSICPAPLLSPALAEARRRSRETTMGPIDAVRSVRDDIREGRWTA
jgi:hypothetical protein